MSAINPWCYAHQKDWRPQTLDARPTNLVACKQCGALHPKERPPYKHERGVDSPSGAVCRARLKAEISLGVPAETGD